jgi:hypothetical protein
MKSNFNELLEQYLTELMPLGFEGYGEVEGAIDQIVKNVMASAGNAGHWAKMFASKKLKGVSVDQAEPLVRELVTDVVHQVFPEKNHTYNPDINKEDLRDELRKTIQKSLELNATYSKFLSDRFAGKDLLGKAKDVIVKGLSKDIENSTETEGKGVELVPATKKITTQKGEKEALKSFLNKPVDTSAEKAPEASVETVYSKAADLNSDDPDLKKAFDKLSDGEDMSWQQVIKKVGTSKALALIDAGALIETEKEKEQKEDEEVPALDASEDEADLSNFDRIINPYFSTTKGSWSPEE